jgi:hypothetical protein
VSAEVRQLLADAAGSVEGITASPYFVQDTKPGRAWVRRDRTDYPNVLGGLVTWNVVVVLPQDMAQAEKFLDAKASAAVHRAVRGHGDAQRHAPTDQHHRRRHPAGRLLQQVNARSNSWPD